MKAQETNVHKLLQGTKVFIVPNFQRRYSWRREQWEDLWSDMQSEYERLDVGGSLGYLDGHFLGSVVLHPAAGPASTVSRYLVIDGQQRLTTLITMIAALRDVRVETEADFDPDEYNLQYLTNPYNPKDIDRLKPTTFDRLAYEETVRRNNPTGGIGQAYSWFRDKLRQAADRGFVLERFGEVALLRFIVVEISTSPNDSVNNIFNTLNSKGMPLSPADLIRNEFLLNLGSDRAEVVYEEHWLPLERLLVQYKARGGQVDDSKLINYFWSQELRHESTLAIKDLFATFERRLKRILSSGTSVDQDALVTAELQRMHSQSDLYLAVLQPEHDEGLASRIPQSIRARLTDLSAWGSTPTIPLTFALLATLVEGRSTQTEVGRALDLILGYLVRRALCGIPTNNLNRLLSVVPNLIEIDVRPVDVSLESLLSRPGYRWPTDTEVVTGAETTALYLTTKRSQSKLILSRLEGDIEPAEPVDVSELTIEHILPQHLSLEWKKDLQDAGESPDEAMTLLHTLGNLTLTGHNTKLSNDRFKSKRQVYARSTVRLSQKVSRNDSWTSTAIRQRGEQLATTATRLFIGPQVPADADVLGNDLSVSPSYSLTDVLNSLSEGDWTTDEALSIALAAPVDLVRGMVLDLGPELARIVRTPEGSVPSWFSPELSVSVQAQAEPLDELDTGRLIKSQELAHLAGWLDNDSYLGPQE